MGDSAGGGLALAIAEQLDLHGLVLFSPWLDLEVPQAPEQSSVDPAGFFTPEELRSCGLAYAGDSLRHTDASPIHLPHLPAIPIHLFNGSADLLANDSRRLESRFPSVDLHEFDGAPHVFPLLPFLPEQRRVLRILKDWIYN
jgi:acetyl esterase/lipase